MKNRLTRAAFLAETSALALAATPALAATNNLIPLAVGNIPDAGNAVAGYALENGYFKDAGLDVDLKYMNNANSISNALLGGSLDIGAGTIGSVAVARSRGVPLRAVAPGSLAENTAHNFVMVRKDSTIRVGADFNNKTVATNAIKTVADEIFCAWIDKNGGDSKTVRFTELPYSAMADAVQAGRTDVALISDPFASMARAQNNVLPVNYFSALPLPLLITCYIATDSRLAANADAAKKFVAAIRRSALWANSHEQQTHLLLTQITKMDPSLVSLMAPTHYATSFQLPQLAPAVDVMMKYGLLDKPVDPKDLFWSA